MSDSDLDSSISVSSYQSVQSVQSGTNRKSVRLRVKSAQGGKWNTSNRDPNFMYDELIPCSTRHLENSLYKNSSGANLNNLNVNDSDNKDQHHRKRRIERKKFSMPKGGELAHKEKQSKLSQQRIDLLFAGDTPKKTRRSLYRVETIVDITQGNLRVASSEAIDKEDNEVIGDIQTQEVSGCPESNSQEGVIAAEQTEEIQMKELLDNKAGYKDGIKRKTKNDKIDISKLSMKEQAQAKLFRALFMEMKDKLVEEWSSTVKSLGEEVKTVKEHAKTINTVQSDLAAAQKQIQVCQLQLNEVIGVTIKQDQMLKECKERIEELTEKKQEYLEDSGFVRKERRKLCHYSE